MSTTHGDSDGYNAEQYREKRLIQIILDDAQNVKEQRRRAEDFNHHDVVDELTAQRMYRMAVEDFIIDSKYKIQETDQQVKVEVDSEELEELSCWEYFWHTAYLGELRLPDPHEDYQFLGLKSIRDFDDPLEVPVEEEKRNHMTGKTTERIWYTYQVPWQVSKKAFEELLDFWGMHGLHITTDDGVPTWSFNEVPDEPEEEAARL